MREMMEGKQEMAEAMASVILILSVLAGLAVAVAAGGLMAWWWSPWLLFATPLVWMFASACVLMLTLTLCKIMKAQSKNTEAQS